MLQLVDKEDEQLLVRKLDQLVLYIHNVDCIYEVREFQVKKSVRIIKIEGLNRIAFKDEDCN